ncbi:MAG: NAD+ synthase [Phycisphaeraceae bacterium]|nr:NAD+ synthase [Phycisphaeraceae bacterium]
MRLALAQLNPTIGDIAGNAERIADAIARARAAHADLLATPELAICGYPPKDLLMMEGFVASCERAARSIGAAHSQGLTLIIGTPLCRPGGTIANSLLAFRDGACIAEYDKRLLPTYDVFDEDRYFEPGTRSVVIDVPTRAGPTQRVGLAICEDLWKGQDAGFSSRYANVADPVEDLARDGARILIVPSASPFVLGKGERHRRILARHATAHTLFVASINQVGGNDDLIFDGHSALLSPRGELIAAAPGFQTDLLLCDLRPDAPARSEPARPRESLLLDALVLGIRDYCAKTGFNKAILGVSGGIDSALVATLAVLALGPENVRGVAMPGPYSSDHALADARDLCNRLGIEMLTLPIGPAFHASAATLNDAFDQINAPELGAKLPDLTEENLQSRLRGTMIMALSNRTGAIVLTTGNKSEMAVGYCTLYGDMNGGLAVLSDVTKKLVYALARHINHNHASLAPWGRFDRPPIPDSSITKPPSAELRPNQTDQDSLPPYDDLDAIIERYVERHQTPHRITTETGLDHALVERIVRLIDLSEYKRKQAAVGLKVTGVAFGSGRRWPIAQRWPRG